MGSTNSDNKKNTLSDEDDDLRDTGSSCPDVTDTIICRDERALQESQRQLLQLMSNLPGMAYRCSNVPDWAMEFCSDGCRDLTGYEPDELVGNKVCAYGDIIHPDDQNTVWDSVQDAIKESCSYQAEYRILTRQGVYKWVWEQGSCVHRRDGEPEILEGLIVDISSRKRAENQADLDRGQQDALSDLLRIGLGPVCLKVKLEQCLDRLLKVTWLSLLPKGAVFIADENSKDTLRMAAARNLPEAVLAACEQVPFGHCLCGRAAQTSEIQYAACVDHRHDVVYQGMVDHGHFIIPLKSGDKLLGVLALYLEHGHPNNQEETRFLKAIGDTLAGIIQREQAEEALRISQERFELAVRGTNDGLWDWHVATNEVWWAARYKELLGYSADELAPDLDFWESRLHPDDRERTLEKVSLHLQYDKPFDVEYRLRTKDGSYRWFRARGNSTRDHDGQAVRMSGSIQDIHERKRMEHQLLHDALHDALTGLPNRVLLEERLAHVLGLRQRVPAFKATLFYLDLDRFKMINDSLGHLAGDQLLVEVGSRLAQCIRSGDTLARLGGDEFVVLQENSDAVEEILEHIQQVLNQPIKVMGHTVYTTASIGVVNIDAEAQEVDDILRDGDTAMYQAKQQGGNQVVHFRTFMRTSVVSRFHTEHELRRAIEQQEFVVHYQPIVALDTARLVGFEALVRWEHAKKGLISPAEFIPVAEETGLILPLGQWVAEEACRQLARWQQSYPACADYYVSVNFSAKQLHQEGMTDWLAALLQRMGMDASQLRLEITESLVMENTGIAGQVLPLLKELGVILCMDDFGTGYSSLSYLHSLPLDVLKIDRSFVHRMHEESRHGDLIESIVSLSHKFDMVVVAEGIETKEQQDALAAIGCDCGQGFYYSRPLPACDIESVFLRKIA